jgi:hypothetical protein
VRPNLPFIARLLIAKSILDVILLGAMSLSFYYSAFNPALRGTLEEAGPEWIKGWAVDLSNKRKRIEVQLYINGRFIESRVADFSNPAIAKANIAADPNHGFFFYTPPLDPGSYEVRVYAVHESGGGQRRTLQQLGDTMTIVTTASPAEPFFKGWLDEATPLIVRGWVANKSSNAPVEVRLYLDNRFIESQTANRPRPDLKQAGMTEHENSGFLFLMPSLVAGKHEARVYAVRKDDEKGKEDLRLVGRPLTFAVGPSENNQGQASQR